jgi:hypothetical protein
MVILLDGDWRLHYSPLMRASQGALLRPPVVVID